MSDYLSLNLFYYILAILSIILALFRIMQKQAEISSLISFSAAVIIAGVGVKLNMKLEKDFILFLGLVFEALTFIALGYFTVKIKEIAHTPQDVSQQIAESLNVKFLNALNNDKIHNNIDQINKNMTKLQKEVQDVRNTYQQAFSDISTWMEEMKTDSEKFGETISNNLTKGITGMDTSKIDELYKTIKQMSDLFNKSN